MTTLVLLCDAWYVTVRGAVASTAALPDSEPVFPHEPDHIIAIEHGGPTTSENLAYACFDCNRAKGSDIASIDRETGSLTPLFSPRTQLWGEHFRHNGPVIEAHTAIGRVTVRLLRMNLPVRVATRESLLRAGHYATPTAGSSSADE